MGLSYVFPHLPIYSRDPLETVSDAVFYWAGSSCRQAGLLTVLSNDWLCRDSCTFLVLIVWLTVTRPVSECHHCLHGFFASLSFLLSRHLLPVACVKPSLFFPFPPLSLQISVIRLWELSYRLTNREKKKSLWMFPPPCISAVRMTDCWNLPIH